MSKLCEGRIVIVTGAGRGIGRGYALEFAKQGAHVVVNDLGAESDGKGSSTGPAGEVVDTIRAAGGIAVANGDDISDPEGAKRLVQNAVDVFGGLDVVVNNAGILRDRMVVSMSIEDWDDVMRVHLRGTFLMTNAAAQYWRDRQKAGGTNDARVINTSSASGLLGNVGQSNYGAAKAGIAAFSNIAAVELARYGVTVNCVSPSGRTRMTMGGRMGKITFEEGQFDPFDPDNVAPVVVWLGSKDSAGISGRVFAAGGGHIGVMNGWHEGPSVDQDARWDPTVLGGILPGLVDKAMPTTVFQSRPKEAPAS